MKFVYTDEELLEIVSRQPLPLTVRRFLRIMNGRVKHNAAYRRLKKMVDRGLLLSKRFHYTKQTGFITVYGIGDQMEKLDEIWKKELGKEGLARYEESWYL